MHDHELQFEAVLGEDGPEHVGRGLVRLGLHADCLAVGEV